ncbi:MAG TPA: hypothetical protein VHL80_18035 [Polyangia bacterium]|nr:hypothetical protein [Polyangia bacterium]
MTYRSLAAVGISILLVSSSLSTAAARTSADEDAAPAKKSNGAKGDDGKWDDDAKASDEPAAGADEESAPKSKPAAKAVAVPVDEAGPPPPAPETTAELGPAPERPPVYGKRSDWFMAPYGYARLDMIEDSTQSFEDGIQPNLIQRAGTYRGDHRRTIITARDSRLGLFVGPPEYRGIRSSSQIEFDFYGLTPTDARRHDTVVFAPLRLRLAYLKLETKVVDVVAGQYYDLFGWNGSFYVGTVGYLGVPAEVYHRNPQLRIEKKLHLGQLDVTVAVAAVRPGERDSGLPEGQAGLKLAYNGWTGASMPGFGRPQLQPLSVGVSGLYRAFEVPVFRAEPGSQALKTYGWGVAAQLLLPIIPVKNLKDRGNALTVIGEYTIGTGIADMYTFMDGGSRFPILPNPSNTTPSPIYQSNVDPGLVTFDRTLLNVKTIDWQAVVGNLQYYLPVDGGRLWIEGTYSRIWSDNIKELTPFASWGGIFTKMEYFDANVGLDITPSVVLGLSFQSVAQTFGDVTTPTPIYGAVPALNAATPGGLSVPGTGGDPISARNNRAQLSFALFF